MDEDLEELDLLFNEIGGNEGAESLATGFDNLPDGTYEAEVISAEWTKSKDGVPMIKMTFGISGEEKQVFDYLMFGHKENDRKKISSAVSRSVTKLRELGLDADTVSGYISQLDKLEGVKLNLRLETTKSGFQNKHYEDVQI